MTRGRPPQKALDEALPIARARGDLVEFVHEPPFACDFMFVARERFCIVRIRRTRHLWCSADDMERQCVEGIAAFRHIRSPLYLSREIWFWFMIGVAEALCRMAPEEAKAPALAMVPVPVAT